MTQGTTASSALFSLLASACHFFLSLVVSAGSVGSTSAGIALLSSGNSPLFAVLVCFLSLVASGGLLSIVSSCFFSSITSDGPLFVVSSCLLSPVTSGGLLSAVFGHFLFFVTSGSSLSAVFSSGLLSLMFAAGSRALFLPSTLFCGRHFFLSSSPFFFSFFTLPAYTTCL